MCKNIPPHSTWIWLVSLLSIWGPLARRKTWNRSRCFTTTSVSTSIYSKKSWLYFNNLSRTQPVCWARLWAIRSLPLVTKRTFFDVSFPSLKVVMSTLGDSRFSCWKNKTKQKQVKSLGQHMCNPGLSYYNTQHAPLPKAAAAITSGSRVHTLSLFRSVSWAGWRAWWWLAATAFLAATHFGCLEHLYSTVSDVICCCCKIAVG